MDNQLSVTVEPHHKVFHRLADSVNASGVQREGLEVSMETRGIDPAELEAAVERIQDSDTESVEDVVESVSTINGFIERSKSITAGMNGSDSSSTASESSPDASPQQSTEESSTTK